MNSNIRDFLLGQEFDDVAVRYRKSIGPFDVIITGTYGNLPEMTFLKVIILSDSYSFLSVLIHSYPFLFASYQIRTDKKE